MADINYSDINTDSIVIEKKHHKSWLALGTASLKNHSRVSLTLAVECADGNNISLTIDNPSVAAITPIHECIDPHNDDKVLEFNKFYRLWRADTVFRQQQRVALSTAMKVCIFLDLNKVHK